jgi:hypothetical protein
MAGNLRYPELVGGSVQSHYYEVSKTHRPLLISLGVFLFGASIATAYLLRHYPDLSLLAWALGIGIFTALLAHLILGLLPRWRPHFWSVAKVCMFLILCVGSYLVTNFYFWERDEQIAKNYVKMIKPSLEKFRRISGHSPVSIGEIANLPSVPSGLIYYKKQDTYWFDYYPDLYWSGTGEWFEDD